MGKQTKKSKRSIGVNLGLTFLSLICAVALWAYVTVVEDPSNEKIITIDQPVIIGQDVGRFTANNLVLLDKGSSVTLTFTGKQSDLMKLTKDTVSIRVDVSSITQPGRHKLSYEVVYPEDLVKRVTYIQDNPYISVNIDKMLSKSIKVEVYGDVNPAENYTLRQPEKSPEYIMVRGPQSVVNQIVEASVEGGISQPLDKTVSYDMPYQLNDADGNSVDMENIDVGDVDTVRIVYGVYLRKEVKLSLSFVDGGGLTEDKNIHYRIEPSTITIIGDPEQIEAINQLYLGQSILLENLLENIDQEYPITLPNGVAVENGDITTAHVTVSIHGIESRQLTIIPRIQGFNEEGYRVLPNNPTLEITLRGSAEALKNVNSTMINAYVDVSGSSLIQNLQYEFPLVIDIGNLTDVGVVGNYHVTVRKLEIAESNEGTP